MLRFKKFNVASGPQTIKLKITYLVVKKKRNKPGGMVEDKRSLNTMGYGFDINSGLSTIQFVSGPSRAREGPRVREASWERLGSMKPRWVKSGNTKFRRGSPNQVLEI